MGHGRIVSLLQGHSPLQTLRRPHSTASVGRRSYQVSRTFKAVHRAGAQAALECYLSEAPISHNDFTNQLSR